MIPRDRYLSDEELARFMEAVRTRRHKHQPRDHALFALLANTGIRPSEAMLLERGDVHVSERPAWIRVSGRRRGSNGIEPLREIVIHEEVATVLARYLDGGVSGRMFPTSPRSVQRLFHYYSRAAGLPRHFRIYSLRHSFGVRLWRHTRDARLIQALMGHVKTERAYIYNLSAFDSLEGAIAASEVV